MCSRASVAAVESWRFAAAVVALAVTATVVSVPPLKLKRKEVAPRPCSKFTVAARRWPGTMGAPASGVTPVTAAVVKRKTRPCAGTVPPTKSSHGFPASSRSAAAAVSAYSLPGCNGKPGATATESAGTAGVITAEIGKPARVTARFAAVNCVASIASSNVSTQPWLQSDWRTAFSAGAIAESKGRRASDRRRLSVRSVKNPAASVARTVTVKGSPICGAPVRAKVKVARVVAFGCAVTARDSVAATGEESVAERVTAPLLSAQSTATSSGTPTVRREFAAGDAMARDGAVPSTTAT